MPSTIDLPPGAAIGADGVWRQVLKEPGKGPPGPGLFLDRDGVLVEEVHYLHRAADVHLIAGAAQVIAKANAIGIPVVVATNQAGIALGHFGWEDFIEVQKTILGDLAAVGAFLDGVFACPHHPQGNPPYAHPDHPGRKPNPGMLLAASGLLALDLSASWIVGDKASDLQAGKNAGLAGGMHVLSGHGADVGERAQAMALGGNRFRALAAPSIAGAESVLEPLNPNRP